VVAVRPYGGDGGVASLRHHAPKRPRVRQVAPQHHVLHQHVPGLLPAFLSNRGDGGRHGSRCVVRGSGAHAGSRRRSADGEADEHREEGGGGGRGCGCYRGWQWKGKEGPHTCEAVTLGFFFLVLYNFFFGSAKVVLFLFELLEYFVFGLPDSSCLNSFRFIKQNEWPSFFFEFSLLFITDEECVRLRAWIRAAVEAWKRSRLNSRLSLDLDSSCCCSGSLDTSVLI
jgi:hypothetical protein